MPHRPAPETTLDIVFRAADRLPCDSPAFIDAVDDRVEVWLSRAHPVDAVVEALTAMSRVYCQALGIRHDLRLIQAS